MAGNQLVQARVDSETVSPVQHHLRTQFYEYENSRRLNR